MGRWRGRQEIPQVNWNSIKLPTSAGGLGSKSLYLFNKAYCANCQMFMEVYHTKWESCKGNLLSLIWSLGRQVDDKGLQGCFWLVCERVSERNGILLVDYILCWVGNGCSVRFQNDAWCGNQSLKYQFPTIFCLARKKDSKIVILFYQDQEKLGFFFCFLGEGDCGTFLSPMISTGKGRLRHIPLTHEPNEWEIALICLCSSLENVLQSRITNDDLTQKLCKNGIFSATCSYSALNNQDLILDRFAWKQVWKCKALPVKVPANGFCYGMMNLEFSRNL